MTGVQTCALPIYRLNVIPIHIPPLRQRREDILLLGKYFLESSVKKNNLEAKGLSPAALNKLISMPWHGNVRELKNVIERSAILSTGDQIEDADIPVNDQYDSDELIEEISSDLPSLKMMERRYILSVLKRHQGRKEMAAKVLGLSRRTLYRKLMDLEIGRAHV